MDKNYGNPTLGEIADVVFTMLGSYCENSGIETKTRNDYVNENTENYSKYNLFDNKSNISRLLFKFYEELIGYKIFAPEIIHLLYFPQLLMNGTKYFINDEYFYKPKKENIYMIIVFYVGFIFSNLPNNEKKDTATKTFDELISETYKKILSENKKFDMNENEIEETATWKTISKILSSIKNYETDEKEKTEVSKKIIRHYIFLGLKKALVKVFDFSEDKTSELMKKINENLIVIHNNVIEKLDEYNSDSQRLDNHCYPITSPEFVYSMMLFKCDTIESIFYPIFKYYDKEYTFTTYLMFTTPREKYYFENPEKAPKEFISMIKNRYFIGTKQHLIAMKIVEASKYFIQSYSSMSKSKAKSFFQAFDSLGNDSGTILLKKWYQARYLVMSLKLDESETDKKQIEDARNLFKEIFDKYKYFIGSNVGEFLSDAIACEVYFNRKKMKDILDNTQDNTNECSINAKAYWEFGYALGIFDEDSKKTYLTNFNAEKNFWINFPTPKFTYRENAEKVYEEDISDEELNLPNLVFTISNGKAENLLSKKNKKIRQKLGKRYYSSLSIAIMRAYTQTDFEFIKNYINSSDSETLFKNDECGANPLIRAMYEYKNCVYGFSKENIQERANTFFNAQKEFEINRYKRIKSNNNSLWLQKFYDSYSKDFVDFIQNLNKDELKKRARNLKDCVIKPLIEKSENHILDEAIQLDFKYCMNALQLAIDSYDLELVKLIVSKLPEKNSDLSKIYISEEIVTPLQYAIRKYDYILQFVDKGNDSKKLCEPLTIRELPNRRIVSKGLLKEDKEFYKDRDPLSILSSNPISFEECGFNFEPIDENESKQCYELVEIIKFLAEKTSKISVDNFYYLAEIIDEHGNVFDSALDLTKMLIETGKADIDGTNFEFYRGFMPNETLLAKCIRNFNIPMLRLLLTNQKSIELLKPTINRIVTSPGLDSKRNPTIVTTTDLDYFFSEAIKFRREIKENEKERLENWTRMVNEFLTLFYKIGAKFDIKDNQGKTTLDYIKKKNKEGLLPEGSIPEEILKMIKN